jgi:hypothetical protein
MAAEVSTALIAQNIKDAEIAASMLRAMFATGSVMRSLLVVAAFVALSSFFRSERLQKLLESSSSSN